MQHRSFLLELESADDRVGAPADMALVPVRVGADQAERAGALWTAVGRGFWTERSRWTAARWRTHLRDAAVDYRIAVHDGADIGFFEFRLARRTATIAGFGLLPDWRAHGLGRVLLCAATETAFAAGADRIRLHTATDDHPHALPNYRARGYRIVRERDLRRPMPSAMAR